MAGDVEVDERTEYATRIVRTLVGDRWTWPPVRVRDRYPTNRGRIRLTGTPVITVDSVRVVDGADLEFERDTGQMLYLPAYEKPCARSRIVEVDYSYGSPPSGLIKHAIDTLSAELRLADENSAACRIPERVTSVTRQGVSWTLIDPQEFLRDGRTGIYEVDLAISAVSNKSRARPRVFSADFPPPDRRYVEVLPIPEETP